MDETFIGVWDFKENCHFLSLKMKLTTGGTDMSAIFYVGASVPEVALGQIHNYGDTIIYSGTAVLIPKKGKLIKNKFFKRADPNSKIIPDYIWEFFEKKEQNILRVTTKVTSTESCLEWQKRQLAKRNKKEIETLIQLAAKYPEVLKDIQNTLQSAKE